MAENAFAVIARQAGARLLPDKDARYTHRLEIRSASSTNLYVVSWDRATQEWQCGCMGWIRNHGRFPGYQCKHLAPMVPALEAARKRTGIAGS
jgi:hypothetical protein